MDDLTNSQTRNLLIEAAKRAAREQGYTMKRLPGRGLASIWTMEKNGKPLTACIRTTQDRWYAFPPLEGGARFKTLDDVEMVFVSAVDSKEGPTEAQVYLFKASEVRKRFVQAYKARTENNERGQPDNYGMWVNLDVDTRDTVSAIGSGIAKAFPAIATYPLAELMGSAADASTEEADDALESDTATPEFNSISDVMSFARENIARLAKVAPELVKLELKIEY